MTPEEIAKRKQDWSNAVQHFKGKEAPVSPYRLSRFQAMLNQDTHLALKTWCVKNQRDMGEIVDLILSEWLKEQYGLND